MRHRLFHSLVLSSSVLLEACGGSASTGTSEASASNETSGGDTTHTGETSAGGNAGVANAGETQTDAANAGHRPVSELDAADQEAVARAVANERACESGWPTTKGARTATDGTHTFWCSNMRSDSPICCIAPTEP